MADGIMVRGLLNSEARVAHRDDLEAARAHGDALGRRVRELEEQLASKDHRQVVASTRADIAQAAVDLRQEDRDAPRGRRRLLIIVVIAVIVGVIVALLGALLIVSTNYSNWDPPV